MNKATEQAVLTLVFLCVLIQSLMIFLFFSKSSTEQVILPIRPPLTHPDPREALIIANIPRETKVENLYSAEEILGALQLLYEDRFLLDQDQVQAIIGLLKQISGNKTRISYLRHEVEIKKRELELRAIYLAEVLNWGQFNFIISNIDLLRLNFFEGRQWQDLLNRFST